MVDAEKGLAALAHEPLRVEQLAGRGLVSSGRLARDVLPRVDARGLAFVRHLLRKSRITRRFPGIRIAVPPALVLATDAFDQFMAENNLLDFALQCEDDGEILQAFLAASLVSVNRASKWFSAIRRSEPATNPSSL